MRIAVAGLVAALGLGLAAPASAASRDPRKTTSCALMASHRGILGSLAKKLLPVACEMPPRSRLSIASLLAG
jgi:broad specificity phosphatase PhoE